MARKGTKVFFIVAGVAVVLIGLWVIAIVVSGLSSGFSGSSSDSFDEKVVIEGKGAGKVAMINVVGEIFSDPAGTARGASDTNIIEQLRAAREDDEVKAVILNLDTPGGGVVASDRIYHKVLETSKDKPVVALMNDVTASGGYYISAAADEIVAHPSTWTGSIGVIALIPNVEQAASKVGVKVEVVKSAALKDLGSPFRAMTDQERAVFQTLIDEAYAGFVDVVATGRDLTPERTRELADGRIYSGKQAKELGLVDDLGDQDLAFAKAKELGKAKGASLVAYRERGGLLDNLLPFVRSKSVVETISQELGIDRSPGAAYLWVP